MAEPINKKIKITKKRQEQLLQLQQQKQQQEEKKDKSAHLAKKRILSYVLLSLVLGLLYWYLRDSAWVGSKQLHTIMEVLATTLALFVGIIALLRYYSKKSNTLLFIGVGFLGTAFLDLYHAVVTSSFFDFIWQNPPESLIPWSWNASRYFLGFMMVVSWLAWRRERKAGDEKGAVSPRIAFLGVGIFALVSFAFFLLYPLPRAYYPELAFGRPEEFGAAALFLIALVGYLKKGLWKTEKFDHWIVYSLIVGFIGQAMFMSHSYGLFDTMFDAAHTLKKVSYICVLMGLWISMFDLFTRITKYEEEERKLSEGEYAVMLKATSENALVSMTDPKGNIVYMNDKFVEIAKYSREELMGQNHRILKSGHQPQEIFEDLWKTISHGNMWNGELKNRAKDGTYYWVRAAIGPVRNKEGKIEKYMAVRFLISDKKELEERAKQMKEKKEELEKMNEMMTGRELKMRELKKKIKGLENKSNG